MSRGTGDGNATFPGGGGERAIARARLRAAASL